MREWRVGSISMGLLLMMTGVLLLLAEFMSFSAYEAIFMWWPVVLIVLGAEVLIYVYTSKGEAPRIKYDGLSIFIIILVIFATLCAYGVKFFLDNYMGIFNFMYI